MVQTTEYHIDDMNEELLKNSGYLIEGQRATKGVTCKGVGLVLVEITEKVVSLSPAADSMLVYHAKMVTGTVALGGTPFNYACEFHNRSLSGLLKRVDEIIQNINNADIQQ